MTFPVTIPLGNTQIHLHLICEILAYSLGFRFYLFLRKKSHDLISEPDRLWIFIGAAAGGFIGSHLLGILERPNELSQTNLIYLMGNKTVMGGLLGGLMGVELTKKWLGVTSSSGDLMTFPLLFGQIIGRIGCFLEGLEDGTFGTPSKLPFAIDFGDGIPRHPTQLYEILFLIILWLSIVYLEKKITLRNGSRFKIYLATYCLFRLMIEFIKPNDFYLAGLCAIQVAALGGILYYWKVFLQPQNLLEK